VHTAVEFEKEFYKMYDACFPSNASVYMVRLVEATNLKL
jgi:hypothetical protein